MTQDTPATLGAEAAAMAEPWERVTALMGGTDAMRAAGEKYLPKAPAESAEAYAYRLKVSTLYGAYRRTVETMAGRPFAEPIKLGEDVPAPLHDYANDIDLEGRDLQAFSHSVFTTALAYGLSHILVDYPKVGPATATLADQKSIGARPYFNHIDPRNVIDWRSERINGVMTLVHLRMFETVTVPTGTWTKASIQQVRVLEPTRYAIYRQNEKKEWVLFEEGPVSIGCVPLATIYTGRTGFMTAEPPLNGLAALNVKHWQKESDSDNIVHVASVPILFASGFAEGKLTIGATSAVTNDDPAAKLQYVEHTGAAIEAGRASLQDLEERMGAMGAELLVSKPGTQTATEVSVDTAESTSALAAMVNNLEDSLELALSFAARWAGLGDSGGTVELEGDYSTLDPLDVQSLVAARESGILSAETVFTEFQRLGMIDEELTWEDEVVRLADDAAKAVAQAQAIKTVPDPLKHDDAVNQVDPTTGAPIAGTGSGASGASGAPGAMAHPAMAHQPADFGPLIDSIGSLVTQLAKPAAEVEAPEAPEPLDLSPIVDAINARKPDDSAQQMVTAVLAIADAMKNAPAPQITVTAPNVTVEAPAAPNFTMPPINVTIEKSTGEVSFTEGPDGEITGAKLN